MRCRVCDHLLTEENTALAFHLEDGADVGICHPCLAKVLARGLMRAAAQTAIEATEEE